MANEVKSRRLRLLFVLPWDLHHIGGVNQVVSNLALSIQKVSLEPTFVLNTQYGCNDLREEMRPNGPNLVRFTLRDPKSISKPLRTLLSYLLHFPSAICTIRKLLNEKEIDTINVHYPVLSSLTIVLAAKYFGPRRTVMLSFHGADISTIRECSNIWRLWWRWIFRHTDAFVFCSQALASEFEQLFPELQKSMHVVHNGIDYEHLLASSLIGRIPDAVQGKRFVLNAATLEHKKGQDVLIEAFAQLASRFPDIKLVIMGRTADAKSGLEQLVNRLGLGAKVLIFNDVPHADVLATMRAAELFVLPSRKEPFGIVLLEAAAFHLPVVASRTGGIAEIVEHEVSGLLVEPDNVSDLATKMARLLNGSTEPDVLTRNLHARVISEFTWRRAAEEYIKIAGC